MARIEEAIDFILVHEGGDKYTNHPKDRGGPTKFGITLATLSAWRGRKCSAADVKALNKSEACEIYRARYWDRARCDEIRSQLVANKIFDMSVNFGVMRRGDDAAEITQRAVVACGKTIRVDGWIGDETIAGVNACNPDKLIPMLCHEQKKVYLDIIARRPSQAVFRRNWLWRARWTGGK